MGFKQFRATFEREIFNLFGSELLVLVSTMREYRANKVQNSQCAKVNHIVANGTIYIRRYTRPLKLMGRGLNQSLALIKEELEVS